MRILISAEQLRQRVAELAAQIDADFRDETPVLIGLLKGSFVFWLICVAL